MAINELIEGYVSCQEAKVQGLKRYFTGKPCKHGHITERYVKDKTCIICSRAHKKKYAQTEQAKEKAKIYQQSEKFKLAHSESVKKYEMSNKCKTYRKAWRNSGAGKDYHKEYNKEYTKTDKRKEYKKEYSKTRLAEDINFKLAKNLRTRLNTAIKGDYKSGSAVRDLGCTIEFLKQHLETQFKDGMNWENHGKVWHIDHIEPLCSFDLTNREQLLKACHYTNLQPLFKQDNWKKIFEDKKKAALLKKSEGKPEKALDGIRALLVD